MLSQILAEQKHWKFTYYNTRSSEKMTCFESSEAFYTYVYGSFSNYKFVD